MRRLLVVSLLAVLLAACTNSNDAGAAGVARRIGCDDFQAESTHGSTLMAQAGECNFHDASVAVYTFASANDERRWIASMQSPPHFGLLGTFVGGDGFLLYTKDATVVRALMKSSGGHIVHV